MIELVRVRVGGPFRPNDPRKGRKIRREEAAKEDLRFFFSCREFLSGLARLAEVLQDYYVIRILLLAAIVGESGDRDRVCV